MRKFTIKDFILYASPCFGCGEKISFWMGFTDLQDEKAQLTHKPIMVTGDSSTLDIRTTYHGNLFLTINHKTNKFQTSDLQEFSVFIKKHQMFLQTNCKKCHMNIDSRFLEFNLVKGFIKPIGISYEKITLTDNINYYLIGSSYFENLSIISIIKKPTNYYDTSTTSLRLEVPILPLYKFKNKNQLIEKIKLYLLFS